VADEVHRLQRGQDAECNLFQKVAEQGHYGGRKYPTDTRQGTYTATPSGILLASVNTNDPRRMEQMLKSALEKWKTIPREERILKESPENQPTNRTERFYPQGGLVLKVISRDLPRENVKADWRANAWNQDFAWFKKEEARQFLPEQPKRNETYTVPASFVQRLARSHFVDNVRGQTSSYPENAVEKAVMNATVQRVQGQVVTLKLQGETRTVLKGTWPVRGYEDMTKPTPQERGMELSLLGSAKYDLKLERFVEFELLAVGKRWGGTQYNGRGDDLASAPIGFVMQLAGHTPAERVAPEHFWSYGWQ
jgi:hypothetical protein